MEESKSYADGRKDSIWAAKFKNKIMQLIFTQSKVYF